jgi:ABC-type hemin transport system ATPase subunit
MAPLPEDDGRKPGDQQARTSEQRHALTRHVDERARDAVEASTTPPEDTGSLDKQRARYAALKAARDRTLVFVLHDIDQAARYADRMVALEDGAIYERGTREEVVTEELLAEVFEIDAEVELTERGPRIVPLRRRHDDETEAQRDRTEVSQ